MGVQAKKPSVGGYGYFLEQHISILVIFDILISLILYAIIINNLIISCFFPECFLDFGRSRNCTYLKENICGKLFILRKLWFVTYIN